ncbi:MAG: 50S ribosomal protein L15 [Alphaproteobacteria bacterium]|jgi:large subunit ribosomal protein L15|uniref:50S ribosomal protein L15 n=1 Tax=Candidatus Megaera polyxenophila TaxID=988779 RepID=UPI001CC5F7BF|nr:50S ribosomal protein L15 [Candidatus Megaera polyxenophila]MBU6184345.1 50S ribosomal protein L15 [Rickettsiales bacterium]MCE2730947.1 50S ribosomal protein L15 [Rickettsiaceae bacterium]NBU52860.1 50S ribosomal protein L15 [Alphaproteobacteria bacterium]UCM93571.1 MAG: 50S ribosomal protein L15 [Candidatus Megaira endosymbiont of Mesostigma viride]HJK85097.1 50S ribosomal protein L15 [Candidatus Megaera endosymbiont of Stentor roeselii]
MRVNSLFNVPGSRKPRKRIGRGNGSGTGRTGGRGEKGQKSRSGVSIKTEGGQMPLIKRLPKRGFNSSKSIRYTPISMADIEFLIIEKRIDTSVVFNKTSLVNIGYIKSEKTPVKLLAGIDKMNFKISVQLDAYSKTAKELIEKAGGQVL